MKTLKDRIGEIEISGRGKKLIAGFNNAFEIIFSEIDLNFKPLLKDDFELFNDKGKFWVNNTFAGGIIFLREPEIIEGIKIDFKTDTNSALATVEYGSENRNSRNVKYKPKAGKFESTEWNMLGIFPNFCKYESEIKVALMMLIARYVKTICEDLNQNSWFMKYEKDFNLELFLDSVLEIRLHIKAK